MLAMVAQGSESIRSRNQHDIAEGETGEDDMCPIRLWKAERTDPNQVADDSGTGDHQGVGSKQANQQSRSRVARKSPLTRWSQTLRCHSRRRVERDSRTGAFNGSIVETPRM